MVLFFYSLKLSLGFDFCFAVNSVGRSGGLCLLWKQDFDLYIRSLSLHHIDALVGGKGDPEHWRLTSFYGFPA